MQRDGRLIMKRDGNVVWNIISMAVIVFFLGLFIWGCYWVAKNVSYKLFYQKMVSAEIVEMVKPEALKNRK